jgi:cytochrome c1
VLGKIATTKPAYFKAYIKDPQSESAYAEMPDFPDYDDATLAALTAYFQVIPAKAPK